MTGYLDLSDHQRRIFKKCIKFLASEMERVGAPVDYVSVVFVDVEHQHQDKPTNQQGEEDPA